ncbi:MAG: sigma-70 family RNA polymerase sigma factor [Sedimentisphaerales bacterium]|nr:sigma-70 family RNA polymerase sigma factor [Sedimentisphaerales bacterium]
MTEETEIIQRVLQGETESFAALVQRYQGPVVRMVRNLTGDAQACEDLAQEVFLAAYAKLETFDPARSRFSTWLFTITRNKCINTMKKKRPVAMGQPPQGCSRHSPDECAAKNELMAKLDRALDALPAKQKRAFVLAEFEALPYEEIARIEGTRVGTVKSRISRARGKLAEVLRRYGAEES